MSEEKEEAKKEEAKYEFTDEMKGIYEYGGGQEQICRDMLVAALEFRDEHPEVIDEIQESDNVSRIMGGEEGLIGELNEVFKETTDNNYSRGQYFAVIGNLMWIDEHNWQEYVEHRESLSGVKKEQLKADELLERQAEAMYEQMNEQKNRFPTQFQISIKDILGDDIIEKIDDRYDGELDEDELDTIENYLDGLFEMSNFFQELQDMIGELDDELNEAIEKTFYVEVFKIDFKNNDSIIGVPSPEKKEDAQDVKYIQ